MTMTSLEDLPLQKYSENQQEKSSITNATFDGYKNNLKGRLYGVLCEREKDGEWEKFLNSIIIELYGLNGNSINWWKLIGKVNMLRLLSYERFRSVIFECMNLVGNLEIPNELS